MHVLYSQTAGWILFVLKIVQVKTLAIVHNLQ